MSKKAFIFLVSGLTIAFGFLIVQAAPTFQSSPTIASSSSGIILQGTPTHYLNWTSYDGNAATAAYATTAGTATNAANSNQVDGYDLNQALTIGASPSFGLLTATAGLTITGAAVNLNAASNFPINIATGASTGAINIGGGSNTLNIATSDWDITTAGAMTGISGITNDGSYTQTGLSANTFTGTPTFSNVTYSALFTGGNVGIKIAVPVQALHVNGYIRADTGFCIGATCITTWPGGGSVASVANSDSTLTVSPTTGAVVASLNLAHANTWTGAQTFSANTNFPGSGIWNTTGNVGVGTTNPATKLSIGLNDGSTNTTQYLRFQNEATGYVQWAIAKTSSNDLSVMNLASGSGNTPVMTFQYVASGGNVGIGTTAPSQKLDVSGYIALQGKNAFKGYDTWLRINEDNAFTSGIYAGSGILRTDGAFQVGGNGSTFIVASTGNVGVGTSTPAYKLDVIGDARINGDALIGNLYSNWSNPTFSFSSYFMAPGGAYFNSGTVYTEAAIQARGGIHNDGAPHLTISGGTSGITYFSGGNVGIGTWMPTAILDVRGDAQVNGLTVGRGTGNLSNNTAFGASALAAGTTGGSNTAVGYQALPSNTTGYENTAVGKQALYSNIQGLFNTAVGEYALYSNVSGQSNVAVGLGAMRDNQYGIENTAIGVEALNHILINNSNYNVAVGRYAGSTISGGMTNMTVADRSVFLGYATMALANGQTNQIVIGNGAIGAGSNTVTLGNTSITTTILRGDVYGGAFIYSSDRNLKTNIKPLDDSLAKILKLRGVTFNWKKSGEPSVGLIAQEVEKVFPELVTGEEGSKGVSYGNLVAPLIEAVKEQQKEIDSLQARIKVLETRKK